MPGLQRSPSDDDLTSRAIATLSSGTAEVLGLLPYSSNYTFLARLKDEQNEILAVYKPTRGEQPLWDFPPGTLAARELAAYLVSEAARWKIVPPTVLRDDLPLGEGSLQLFVEHDPDRHYFAVMDEYRDVLRIFAAFDIVTNNADRKGGHVIEDSSRRLWAVDHGLTFNAENKLRTVIWAFAGEALDAELRKDLEALGELLEGSFGRELAGVLSDEEARATLERVEALLLEDTFPAPAGNRPLPWPLV
ncbi:MAG: SCO1664 family protein [Actinomycetota bacterium]